MLCEEGRLARCLQDTHRSHVTDDPMRFDLPAFRSAALLGCSGAVFSALSLLAPPTGTLSDEPSTPVVAETPAPPYPAVEAPEPVALDLETVLETVVPLTAGEASYYAASLDGNPTASGEPYDHDDLTAAHRTLPFGTRLLVRNERNGKEVVVTVNDRGPFVRGRVIDLSGAAAQQLGMVKAGTARVAVAKIVG